MTMETKFKLGAKVRVIKEIMDGFTYDGNNGHYEKGYIGTITKIDEISEISEGKRWLELDNGCDIIEDLVELVDKTEEKKMELKECNKKNLAEAKKKVEAERMNAEVTFAAGEYGRITDRMDTLNREIKTRQEDLVEYEKQLAPFKGK